MAQILAQSALLQLLAQRLPGRGDDAEALMAASLSVPPLDIDYFPATRARYRPFCGELNDPLGPKWRWMQL